MSKAMGSGRQESAKRQGFTLVELLVVIAIIGVLVGLTVPAVLGTIRSFTKASIKFEVQGLSDAVEKYRTKHGDYPPDGSSWPIMEAHLRKAFPNILISELNLLNPAFANASNSTYAYLHNDYEGRVMDPAEAVVFFLGGFSTDAQRPFTGPGGPFALAGTTYSYNPSRQNPFYEFPTARLIFDDELAYNGTVDQMPVFLSYRNDVATGAPYVYFDSRTYQVKASPAPFFNYHVCYPAGGAARPMLANPPSLTTSPNYENLKTFQIMSPGMDGSYGGRIATATDPVILFTTKGNAFKPNNNFTAFVVVNPFNLNEAYPFNPPPQPFALPEHPKRTMNDDASNVVEANTVAENL